MGELRVHNFSMSLDGYAAGPAQDQDHPLGVGGHLLHEWVFPEGTDRTPVDEAFIARGDEGVGATVMGRNMFGPVRGDWARRSGPGGGVRTRRTTTTSSCSPPIPGYRSPWPAERSSSS